MDRLISSRTALGLKSLDSTEIKKVDFVKMTSHQLTQKLNKDYKMIDGKTVTN